MGRREHHDARFAVDALDRQAIDLPVAGDHDFDIGLVGPRPEQSRGKRQRVARQVGGQIGAFQLPVGVLGVRVRCASPDGSPPVDEQVPKVPIPFLDTRHRSDPDLTFAPFPTRDRLAAADDRRLAGLSGVGDREVLVAGVLRPEGQRFLEAVDAGAQVDVHVGLQPCGDQLPHGIAGLGNRRQRLVLGARVRVVAAGSDEQVGCRGRCASHRRVGSNEQQYTGERNRMAGLLVQSAGEGNNG